MSKFYLEREGPKRDQKAAEQEFRGQVASMLPHSSFKGKVNPATERIEVLQAIGPAIYRQFQETASSRGELICEEYLDNRGVVCKRYHGDPRAGVAQTGVGCRVKLSEVTHFDGRAYLKGREPKAVKAAMLLRSNGLE